MADLDGYLNGLPFPSNTNDFRTSTHCHFNATSINATTIRVSVEATSGSATSLGTGGNRYRYVYAWIYNEAGTQIGYGSVQIKTENEWWNKSETRTRSVDITIPFKSGGHVLVTATIDGGLDTNSLRWTNSNKHPEQDTFSWPTYNTAPVAGTASVSPAVFVPGNSVTISWNSFSDSENNITGYDIDWTTNGTTWNNLTDKPAGTSSMTDFPGVARGSRQKYRVRAFDTFGLTSAFAETGWTYANTLPSAPTGVSTSATIVEPGTNIPVSFTESTDTYGPVSYYEVKMQDASSVDYNGGTPLIICYSSPGYVPTTGWSRGARWKFLVRAVDELDEAGPWSTATALVKINSIPGVPSGGLITQTMFETGNVTVNFTPGSDADGNASSHEIQYSVSTNKGVSWGGWAAAGTATSTATSFSHALSLNRGEYARYRVRLTDSLGQASSWATSSDYVIKNVLPSAPTAYSTSTVGGGAINTALSYKLTDTIALTATKNEKATPYNVSGFLIASMSFYVYNSAGALISSVLNQTDFAISQTLTSLSMTRGNSYYILVKQKDAAGVLGDATLRYPSSGYININNGPGAFGNVYEQTTQVTLVGANAITPYSGNYISNVVPLSSNLAGGTVNYTFYYRVGGVDYSFATASRATGVSTRIDVTWNFSTYGGPNVLTPTYNSTGTYKIVAIDSEGYSVTKTISITVTNRRSFYSGQTFSPTLTLVRASTAALKGTTIKEGENFTISIGNFSNSYFYATSTVYWELYYQTSLDNSTFSNDTLITSFSSTNSIVAPYVTPSFTVPTPWTTNSKFYVRYYVKVKNDVLANQVTAYDNTNGKHRIYIWKANPSFSVVSAKRNTGTTMSIVVNLVSIGASSDTNLLNDSLHLSATTATTTRIGIIYKARAVETIPVTPSITGIAADWSTTTSDGKIEVSGTNYLTTGGLPQAVLNISLNASSLNAAVTYDVIPYIVRRATGATASTSFISYLSPIVVKPLGSLFSFVPWGIYIGEAIDSTNLYGSTATKQISKWPGYTLAVGGTVLSSAFRPKLPLFTDVNTALTGVPYSWNIFFDSGTPKLKWTNNSGVVQSGVFDFGSLPTGLTSGSTSSGFINYSGTTSTTGQFNGGTTAPAATTRLNYNGYLYATKLYSGGSEVWHSGNDGTGSGLDADTVDGIHASTFMSRDYSQASDLNEVTLSGLYRQEEPSSGFNYTTTMNFSSGDGRQQLTIDRSGSGMKFRGVPSGSGTTGWSPWKEVWHSGNDGTGSGLDADTLDGLHGTSYMPAITQLVNGKSMNTVTETGFYCGYNMTNAAVTGISTFIVNHYSPDWIDQIQIVTGATPQMYMRSRHSGTTWGAWQTTWSTANLAKSEFAAASHGHNYLSPGENPWARHIDGAVGSYDGSLQFNYTTKKASVFYGYVDIVSSLAVSGSITEGGTALSSKYAPVSHSHNYLPIGTGGAAIQISGNVHTVRETGLYMGYAMTNAYTGDWYYYQYFKHDSAHCVVITYPLNLSGIPRWKKLQSGTWGSWFNMAS